jgi:hypothetical protein
MFDTVFPRRIYLRAAPWMGGTALRPSVWKDKIVVKWDDDPDEDTIWSTDVADEDEVLA